MISQNVSDTTRYVSPHSIQKVHRFHDTSIVRNPYAVGRYLLQMLQHCQHEQVCLAQHKTKLTP